MSNNVIIHKTAEVLTDDIGGGVQQSGSLLSSWQVPKSARMSIYAPIVF